MTMLLFAPAFSLNSVSKSVYADTKGVSENDVSDEETSEFWFDPQNVEDNLDDIYNSTPTNIYILEDPKKAVINVDGDDINGIVKRAGDIITYNIIYKNPAEDERVATVTDVIPEDVEFIEAVHQGSYNVDTGKFEETADKNFPASYDAATHTVTWTIPTAAKCQEMASVSVRILDSARNKVLKNTAEVYIPDEKKDERRTYAVIYPCSFSCPVCSAQCGGCRDRRD